LELLMRGGGVAMEISLTRLLRQANNHHGEI